MSEIRKNENISAQTMVLEAEEGGREPSNPLVANFILYLALFWSVFQLYVSSREQVSTQIIVHSRMVYFYSIKSYEQTNLSLLVV